jgi:hypothetical protein
MSENNVTAQQTIQAISTLTAAVALGALIVWAKRNAKRWWYAILPGLWLLHVVVFYVNVLAEDSGLILIAHPEFGFWSALIRLQGVSIFLGIVLALTVDRLNPYK